MEAQTPLEPLMVFVDLENIIPVRSSYKNPVQKIDWFLKLLVIRLKERGFQPNIWAVARDERVSPKRKQKVTFAFQALRHEMCWCSCIADSRLYLELAVRLRDNKLSRSILLVSSDGDFAELLETIKEEGHRVFVTGTNPSKELVAIADETLHVYNELLKQKFSY